MSDSQSEHSMKMAQEIVYEVGVDGEIGEEEINTIAALLDRELQAQHRATVKECLKRWIAHMDLAMDEVPDERLNDMPEYDYLNKNMASSFQELFDADVPRPGDTE